MTPDQVYHRLCDAKVLKRKGGKRVAHVRPEGIGTGKDGYVKALAADGTPIRLKPGPGGKSVARMLMERAKAKEHRSQRRGH